MKSPGDSVAGAFFVCGLRGEQDGVNDMNDAVVALDVCAGDGGVVDFHAAAGRVNLERTAFDCRGTHRAGDVGGHDLAGNDMVGQNFGKLGNVLQKTFDRTGGKLLERVVGRGEDGERTGSFEGIHKSGGLNGGDECCERSGGDCCVNDVCHDDLSFLIS